MTSFTTFKWQRGNLHKAANVRTPWKNNMIGLPLNCSFFTWWIQLSYLNIKKNLKDFSAIKEEHCLAAVLRIDSLPGSHPSCFQNQASKDKTLLSLPFYIRTQENKVLKTQQSVISIKMTDWLFDNWELFQIVLFNNRILICITIAIGPFLTKANRNYNYLC